MRLVSGAGQRVVDPRERLVATERDDGLEDPRRDRAAADRQAHRLEDLARLDLEPLDDAAQRRLDALDVERIERRAACTTGTGRTRPAS